MNFVFDPSLVLYLPLYELDGSSFMSKDACGHICTVTGALWRPTGRYFDGVDDKIDCGNDASLQLTNNVSWHIRFKTPGTFVVDSVGVWNTLGALYSKYTGGDRSYLIGIGNKEFLGAVDNLVIQLGDPADGSLKYRGYYDTNLLVNTWYDLTVTFSSGNLAVSLNDTDISLTVNMGAVPASLWNSSENLYINAHSGGTSSILQVSVEKALIYNKALTPQEIQQNYLATKGRYQ